MSRHLPWHALAGAGRPATARDERSFVAELVTLAQLAEAQESAGFAVTTRTASSFAKDLTLVPGTDMDRDQVTAVMTALRCGASLTAMLELLVSADARELLAAYELVQSRLGIALDQWDEILAEGLAGRPVHVSVSEPAAGLMPVPVRVLIDSPSGSLSLQAARIASEVASLRKACDSWEYLLDHPDSAPRLEPVDLGRKLYDPYFGGLWHEPMFLPQRVGELSPVRLACLLGEQP